MRSEIENYLGSLRGASTSTLRQYRERLGQLEKFLDNKPLTKENVELWIEHLLNERGVCNSSAASYRATAKQVLEHTYPDVSFRKMRFEGLKSAPRRREIFRDWEIQDLLKATSGEWHLAIWIASETALRLGDIAMLTWTQIVTEEGGSGIRLEPHKTQKHGRLAECPISEKLAETLAKRHLESSSWQEHLRPYVFPDLSTRYQIDGHSTLSVMFLRLAAKAGIKGKSFHLIRGYRITEWIIKGHTAEFIGSLTGQTCTQVLKYSKISLAAKRRILCQW